MRKVQSWLIRLRASRLRLRLVRKWLRASAATFDPWISQRRISPSLSHHLNEWLCSVSLTLCLRLGSYWTWTTQRVLHWEEIPWGSKFDWGYRGALSILQGLQRHSIDQWSLKGKRSHVQPAQDSNSRRFQQVWTSIWNIAYRIDKGSLPDVLYEACFVIDALGERAV